MAVEHRCQRHGRPAVASRVRFRPDGTQETEYLCEIDLAEERMSSRLRGRSLFDEFFSDVFGQTPSAGRVSAPARQVERVDVTQFFSDATRELLQRAAQTALEWGSLDLDTDHLLHAALRDDVVRHVLRAVDADPDAIAAQLEEEAERAQRTDVAPSLSPDAKAALLAAYDESRELGASYVGPEHVLLALARDSESEAGQLLERFGASHTKLRGGVIRGVEPTGGARETSRTPRLDEYGRDLSEEAREGKLDPVIGRADEIDQAIEILSRRTKNNPALLGEPGVGKTAIVEGIAQRIVNDAGLVPRFQPVLVREPTVEETIEILHGLKDRYEAFHRVRISDEAIVAAAELSDRYIRDRFLPDKAIDLIDQSSARVRLRARTKADDTRSLEEDLRRLARERDQATAAEDYERAREVRDEVESRRQEFEERRTGRQRAAEGTPEDIAAVVSRATGIPVSQL